MEEYGNSINFYGTTSGNGKYGDNASLGDVLVEHKTFCIKRRNVLSVVDPDEEEQEHDHVAE